MKYIFSQNTIHGIGCIAVEDIKKGDIVAEEPYFIVKKSTQEEYNDYYWNGPHKTNVLINGLGNYCNHSQNHNIRPIINTNKPLISFKAVRDIKKGEELFNNYGPNYFKSRNMQIIGDNQTAIQENKSKISALIKKNTHNKPAFLMGRMF
tara:strand:- start:542 stop:991 length:450 start_codon:yes stop_codon:yes gene_type:complete